jgi:hypothetical protein
MMRIAILALLALSGCVNLQGTYDTAARRECSQIIDADDRRACFNSVEENSSQRRSDSR